MRWEIPVMAGLWPGSEPASERGIRVEALSVQSDGAQLTELSRPADQGVLVPRVAQTFPLHAAAKAHARLADGGLSGRIVLVP
ncbi:zinc-binding dehydrogenase [Nocardioides sp. NPDC047086]|uniref:zinc-binding dehydrogenase n=1 Tax=Nocardioides sp. NPDC047086 TaxID=3154810 RepID=UPI00340F27DE